MKSPKQVGVSLAAGLLLILGCGNDNPVAPVALPLDLVGFVRVEPGTFTMGSPANEPGRLDTEVRHQVMLTRVFYLSDHEVTQAEWLAVMGWNESHSTGDNRPVEDVTWYDCVEFCNRKSQAEGLVPAYTSTNAQMNGNHIVSATVSWNQSANGYRLPTEAEWEYACRAGSQTALCNGVIGDLNLLCDPIDPNLNLVGWYCGNSGRTTHDVKGKSPNAWNLYDMHGNVWEWCWDRYASYPTSAVTDPTGAWYGSDRVFRGGCWYSEAVGCRSASRLSVSPGHYHFAIGLRVSRAAPSPDTTAPVAVTDLRVVSSGVSMRLAWTAPGDDGPTGTASQYDIRYSTSGTISEANWNAATQVTGEPVPKACGSSESFTVTWLSANTTYWFALKTADEVPNWSLLSSVASGTTQPLPPPPSGLVLLQAGVFTMGSPPDESGPYRENQHPVTLTRPFYISDHEVTQAEWMAVTGWNDSPPYMRGDSHPVAVVTWFDCVEFCNRCSDAEGLTEAYTITGRTLDGNHIVWATVSWNQSANGYRLPTEAEWEYACRAGSQTALCNGSITSWDCNHTDPNLNLVGWYCGNSGSTTHDVKGKSPNAWNLYDMHGNVAEWCWDLYDSYPSGAVTDPTGAGSGPYRVCRGGNWGDSAAECRSATRSAIVFGGAGGGSTGLGLRLSRTAR